MMRKMNAVNSRTGNGVLRRGVLALVVLLLALCFVGAVSAGEEGSAVARIGNEKYTNVQDALNESQSGDTVELLQDVTVDTWYQYGDVPSWKVIPDNVIFDGKGYQLTVNSVSSLGNGDYLFRNQGYITIQNMKVVMNEGNGAFSLHDSVVKNVSITRTGYDGASPTGYGILTGSNVTIAECTFNGMAHAIYTNDSGTGTGIVVENCTFNCERAMILRNNEIFTKNTLKSVCTMGITVDTTATSTITENNFEEGSRLKLYEPREATAPVIEDNIISGSIVVDSSAQSVSIGENTITGYVDPKIENAVASIGDMKYTMLSEALNAAVAKIGTVTVEILADVQLSGESGEWKPPIVNLGVVTINGNNHYISGLDKPLIGSTWAGNSGLVINDLTIKDSTIIDDKDDTSGNKGVGAFCGYPSASTIITLQNCHLINSTVEGGHWTGGLVGAACGYSGSDGPVFMELTIKGCSVRDSTITGKGSCGAVVGHATQDDWTKFIIEDTTITGNTITSTGSYTNKSGSVMGTIGVAGSEKVVNGESHTGGVYLSAYVRDNIVTSAGTSITTVYGRQGNDPGKLHITGGMYDPFPYKQDDDFVTSIELVKINGMWQKPQPPVPVISSSGDGNMNNAYRVLFETNGGSFIRPATDLSAGDKITAPANPVKDGYTFAGWYKDEACTQAWDFTEGIPGDMSLYAGWTADTPQTTETAEPTAKATAEQTAAPTKAPATTAPTAVATTAAPAATTAAGVSPTLTQAPAPVLGALLGLLAAGVLIRRRE